MSEDAAQRQPNRLAGETSPYLLQHAHNPVDWYPWSAEALRRAREENRPILLSVGYSACHWCHVMERESFENEVIARLMNEHFVNIKVDREERPDIDHLYMTAVQMMTGQGGWPMTVFLTPGGKPFYGGTYFPPDDRYGRPGFPRVLLAVADAWTNRREEVEQQGSSLVEQIRLNSEVPEHETPVTTQLFDDAYKALDHAFDDRFGGFGGAPKFPQPMICDFLLRYWRRTGQQRALDMAVQTLEHMAMGGMYDHLGGGFHRYSTDAHWLVPHFEKMLYDNAQLAQTYLRAWKATGRGYFRQVVEETLDYVQREMTSPLGGFYSTQDADSEGEEGKYFVWTAHEVQEALGPDDAAIFSRVYGVTPQGNWEGTNILHLSAHPQEIARSMGVDSGDFQERLKHMRERLLATREEREKPGRDEKVLTGWNGLMLAAFADAAASLDRPDYRDTAERNAEFLLGNLYRDGRLLRTGKADGDDFRASSIPAFLEDYACLSDGLLHLYEATYNLKWLEAARGIAETMISSFQSPDSGFFDTPADGEQLVDRPRDISDNATPSGNSVAVEVLLRLHALTGKEEYHQRAASVLRRLAHVIGRHPQAFGRLLCAADFFVGPVKELVVIGPLTNSATQELIARGRRAYLPNLVTMAASGPQPDFPLLDGRGMLGGRPTAYVCENRTCQRPSVDPEEIAKQLFE